MIDLSSSLTTTTFSSPYFINEKKYYYNTKKQTMLSLSLKSVIINKNYYHLEFNSRKRRRKKINFSIKTPCCSCLLLIIQIILSINSCNKVFALQNNNNNNNYQQQQQDLLNNQQLATNTINNNKFRLTKSRTTLIKDNLNYNNIERVKQIKFKNQYLEQKPKINRPKQIIKQLKSTTKRVKRFDKNYTKLIAYDDYSESDNYDHDDDDHHSTSSFILKPNYNDNNDSISIREERSINSSSSSCLQNNNCAGVGNLKQKFEFSEEESFMSDEEIRINNLLMKYYNLEPTTTTTTTKVKQNDDDNNNKSPTIQLIDLPKPLNVKVLIISWYPPILKLTWNLNVLAGVDLSKLNFFNDNFSNHKKESNNVDSFENKSTATTTTTTKSSKQIDIDFDLDLALGGKSFEKQQDEYESLYNKASDKFQNVKTSTINDSDNTNSILTKIERHLASNDNINEETSILSDDYNELERKENNFLKELKRRRFLIEKSLTGFQVTYNILNSRFKIIEEYPPYLRSITLERLIPATEYSLQVVAIYLNGKYKRPSQRVTFISPTDNESRRFKENTYRPIHRYPDEIQELKYGSELVRCEELTIVGFALCFWFFTIYLFVLNWGKIRMLEPYQPAYRESPSTNALIGAVQHNQQLHSSMHNLINVDGKTTTTTIGGGGGIVAAGMTSGRAGSLVGSPGGMNNLSGSATLGQLSLTYQQQQQQQQATFNTASGIGKSTAAAAAAGTISPINTNTCCGQSISSNSATNRGEQINLLQPNLSNSTTGSTTANQQQQIENVRQRTGSAPRTSDGTLNYKKLQSSTPLTGNKNFNIKQQTAATITGGTSASAGGFMLKDAHKRFDTLTSGDFPNTAESLRRTDTELGYLFQAKAQALAKATKLWSRQQQYRNRMASQSRFPELEMLSGCIADSNLATIIGSSSTAANNSTSPSLAHINSRRSHKSTLWRHSLLSNNSQRSSSGSGGASAGGCISSIQQQQQQQQHQNRQIMSTHLTGLEDINSSRITRRQPLESIQRSSFQDMITMENNNEQQQQRQRQKMFEDNGKVKENKFEIGMEMEMGMDKSRILNEKSQQYQKSLYSCRSSSLENKNFNYNNKILLSLKTIEQKDFNSIKSDKNDDDNQIIDREKTIFKSTKMDAICRRTLDFRSGKNSNSANLEADSKLIDSAIAAANKFTTKPTAAVAAESNTQRQLRYKRQSKALDYSAISLNRIGGFRSLDTQQQITLQERSESPLSLTGTETTTSTEIRNNQLKLGEQTQFNRNIYNSDFGIENNSNRVDSKISGQQQQQQKHMNVVESSANKNLRRLLFISKSHQHHHLATSISSSTLIQQQQASLSSTPPNYSYQQQLNQLKMNSSSLDSYKRQIVRQRAQFVDYSSSSATIKNNNSGLFTSITPEETNLVDNERQLEIDENENEKQKLVIMSPTISFRSLPAVSIDRQQQQQQHQQQQQPEIKISFDRDNGNNYNGSKVQHNHHILIEPPSPPPQSYNSNEEHNICCDDQATKNEQQEFPIDDAYVSKSVDNLIESVNEQASQLYQYQKHSLAKENTILDNKNVDKSLDTEREKKKLLNESNDGVVVGCGDGEEEEQEEEEESSSLDIIAKIEHKDNSCCSRQQQQQVIGFKQKQTHHHHHYQQVRDFPIDNKESSIETETETETERSIQVQKNKEMEEKLLQQYQQRPEICLDVEAPSPSPSLLLLHQQNQQQQQQQQQLASTSEGITTCHSYDRSCLDNSDYFAKLASYHSASVASASSTPIELATPGTSSSIASCQLASKIDNSFRQSRLGYQSFRSFDPPHKQQQPFFSTTTTDSSNQHHLCDLCYSGGSGQFLASNLSTEGLRNETTSTWKNSCYNCQQQHHHQQQQQQQQHHQYRYQTPTTTITRAEEGEEAEQGGGNGSRQRISSVFVASPYSRAHRDSFAMLRALSQKKSKSAEDVAYLSSLVLQIWCRDRNPLLQSATSQQQIADNRRRSTQTISIANNGSGGGVGGEAASNARRGRQRPKSSLTVSHL